MNKLSILGAKKVEKKEQKEKISKFTPDICAFIEDGCLKVCAEVSIDFEDPKTLEILEGLKLSESGKGYNAAFAQIKGVDEMSGQFSLNIKADKLEGLIAYAKSMSKKK